MMLASSKWTFRGDELISGASDLVDKGQGNDHTSDNLIIRYYTAVGAVYIQLFGKRSDSFIMSEVITFQ